MVFHGYLTFCGKYSCLGEQHYDFCFGDCTDFKTNIVIGMVVYQIYKKSQNKLNFASLLIDVHDKFIIQKFTYLINVILY